jgi:hypothetical protein
MKKILQINNTNWTHAEYCEDINSFVEYFRRNPLEANSFKGINMGGWRVLEREEVDGSVTTLQLS